MKQFFKMFFASILGVFIATGCLVLLGIVMLAGMVASLDSSSTAYIPKAGEKVLKLSLAGAISETAPSNPFGALLSQNESLSLKDILTAIDVAKESDHIKGIYLDGSAVSTGWANRDLIRRKLLDFKQSGKFIVAYADNYTQGGYYLASIADKVFLNPQGAIILNGLSSSVTFYRGLFKKIGVEYEIFKVGTYKGAVEPFMLDKFSDANREQISSYQQSIWDNLTEDIAASRNLTVDGVNAIANEGMQYQTGAKIIEKGLADELKYSDEVEDYIKELAGIDADKKLKTIDVSKAVRMQKQDWKKNGTQIAVICAEGEIVSSEMSSYLGNSAVITEKFADELAKLKKDDKVKAVVLRVNSPGGSGFVSEQIWKQVRDLKKDKKIVVSMGNVAASGGYYIACAADRIIAEKNTITGSIGVFGMIPTFGGLYDKLDLTTDVVKTNTFADFGDLERPMRTDEKALLQSYIENFYDVFLTRCADGRSKSKDEIDKIGQGRVWTGEQAIGLGLVDEIGDLDHAIKVAAELAEIEDYSIKTVETSTDPISEYLKKQMGDIRSSIVREALGEDIRLFNSLKAIKYRRGVQALLPLEVEY
ncbi:MAG: signal peptide peptidase SppA [Tannerella sp.]|jgi:protease-4|nr:signal peptide peptidase SppA [Tannerella sp.]